MKLIGLEQHFAPPELVTPCLGLDPSRQDLAVPRSTRDDKERMLFDLADARIAAMEEVGTDVQVLSLTSPGVQTLDPEQAVLLARSVNDLLATTVRHRPDRFQAFATLPFGAPEEASRDLERAVVELDLNGAMVFGRVGARNMDHPDFRPILEVAARLRAPLYLHPQTPPVGVREAYYQGLDEGMEGFFATSGIGWHYESGMQAARLVLSGAFERLPDLRLILGHWGEVVLFYIERLDILTPMAKLPRPVSEYFKSNIWVTPSGLLSPRYMRWAIEVMGVERIMFATDYPFLMAKGHGARRYLEEAGLSPKDRDRIACGNWEALVADIRR